MVRRVVTGTGSLSDSCKNIDNSILVLTVVDDDFDMGLFVPSPSDLKVVPRDGPLIRFFVEKEGSYNHPPFV